MLLVGRKEGRWTGRDGDVVGGHPGFESTLLYIEYHIYSVSRPLNGKNYPFYSVYTTALSLHEG